VTNWNFADAWELCAEVRGEDKIAFVHGDRRLSWAEVDRRAAGVATALLEASSAPGQVAQYLYNCPEYLESVFAFFQGRPRAGERQLPLRGRRSRLPARQLRFRGCGVPRRLLRLVLSCPPRLPRVRLWLTSTTDPARRPPFAVPYEVAASSLPAGADNFGPGAMGPQPDDLYLLYDRCTTGLPKGVMWRTGRPACRRC